MKVKEATKAKKQISNIFIRILKSPITVLQKVTDLYINSVSSCADRFGENNVVMNCSIAPQVSQLPRNFSVGSSKGTKDEDELKDLIRAVSTKLISEAKIEIKNVDQFQKPKSGRRLASSTAVEKRSYSCGIGKIGRIDEDAPCDFKEADTNVGNVYPRCKSCAVPNRINAVRS